MNLIPMKIYVILTCPRRSLETMLKKGSIRQAKARVVEKLSSGFSQQATWRGRFF